MFCFLCMYGLLGVVTNIWWKFYVNSIFRNIFTEINSDLFNTYCTAVCMYIYIYIYIYIHIYSRWEELLNKVVIFIFFVYKKYSPSLQKVPIEQPWWQMDCFDDAFHTFLGLDSVIYLTANGTVPSLPVFIQNILNCVFNTISFIYSKCKIPLTPKSVMNKPQAEERVNSRLCWRMQKKKVQHSSAI